MYRLIKLFARLVEDKYSPKYQRYNLIKIEKENKHLSKSEIIKLKKDYLNKVERILNHQIKSINQRL